MFKRRHFLLTVVALLLGAFGGVEPLHPAPFQPGQIFVAYGGNQIAQISPPYDLSNVSSFSLSQSFAEPAWNLQGGGVALDENGYLYVTFGTVTGNRGIVKIASSGDVVKTITVGTFPDFRGIAVKSGKVAVATNSGVRIYDSDLNNLLQTLSGNYRDVVFDDKGNLYALHQQRVDRYKLVGGSYQLDRTVVSGLTEAVALAFDSAGNLYVVDRSGQQVKKFVRTGDSFSSDPTTISRPLSITGGSLFGLDYEPGINTFFVVNTSSDRTDLLKFSPNDTTMSAVFSSTSIKNARWLAVYPTPEPATVVLLLAGLGFMMRKRKRNR